MRRMYSKPQLLEAVESESKLNGIKVFEDIKDKDGHARFIEESITPEEISGMTFTYAKWSLSGTHLMIVLAGNIANTTALTNGTNYARVKLPKWILDKIYPTFLVTILRYTQEYWAENYSTQTAPISLLKSTNDLIISTNGITANNDRLFRIQFDLLIDNE